MVKNSRKSVGTIYLNSARINIAACTIHFTASKLFFVRRLTGDNRETENMKNAHFDKWNCLNRYMVRVVLQPRGCWWVKVKRTSEKYGIKSTCNDAKMTKCVGKRMELVFKMFLINMSASYNRFVEDETGTEQSSQSASTFLPMKPYMSDVSSICWRNNEMIIISVGQILS